MQGLRQSICPTVGNQYSLSTVNPVMTSCTLNHNTNKEPVVNLNLSAATPKGGTYIRKLSFNPDTTTWPRECYVKDVKEDVLLPLVQLQECDILLTVEPLSCIKT